MEGLKMKRQLVLSLAGIRRAAGILTDDKFREHFGYSHEDINCIENQSYNQLIVGQLEEYANDLGYELEINFVIGNRRITLKKENQ
jgi:hypothetical protein